MRRPFLPLARGKINVDFSWRKASFPRIPVAKLPFGVDSIKVHGCIYSVIP
jgi:hypothetical protein